MIVFSTSTTRAKTKATAPKTTKTRKTTNWQLGRRQDIVMITFSTVNNHWQKLQSGLVRSHLITSKMFLSRWKETLVQVWIAGKKYKEFLWTPGSEKEKLIRMKLSCEKSIQCMLLLHWIEKVGHICKALKEIKKKIRTHGDKEWQMQGVFYRSRLDQMIIFLVSYFFSICCPSTQNAFSITSPKKKNGLFDQRFCFSWPVFFFNTKAKSRRLYIWSCIRCSITSR